MITRPFSILFLPRWQKYIESKKNFSAVKQKMKLKSSLIFHIILFGSLVIFNLYLQNYFAVCLNSFFLILFCFLDFYMNFQRNKLEAKLQRIKSIKKILQKPVIQKDENCVIFNFLIPSEKLKKEIEKI
jgi:hypothetical protein